MMTNRMYCIQLCDHSEFNLDVQLDKVLFLPDRRKAKRSVMNVIGMYVSVAQGEGEPVQSNSYKITFLLTYTFYYIYIYIIYVYY